MTVQELTKQELRSLHEAGSGFVINLHFPTGDGHHDRPAVLHEVACKTLLGVDPRYKLFAGTLDGAKQWLATNKGREGVGWTACGICNPSRHSRQAASVALATADAVRYVLNDLAQYGPDSPPSRLHLADCRSIARMGSARRNFSDLNSAALWLRTNRGPEGDRWQRCGICRPPTVTTALKVERQATSAPTRSRSPSAAIVDTESIREMVDRLVQSGTPTRPAPPPARPPVAPAKAEPPIASRSGEGGRGPETADLEKELGNARATIAALKARINALEASAKSSVEDLGRRELEIVEASARLDSLVAKVQAQVDALEADGADHRSTQEQASNREAELQAQLADVQNAWEALVHDNDQLRAGTATAEARLAASARERNALERELVDARARASRAGADQGPAPAMTELVVHLADEMASAGSLTGQAGLRAIEAMIAAAGDDPRLRVRRGRLLAETGHDKEAVAILTKLEGELSRDNLAVLAHSSLRAGSIPSPSALASVDWATSGEFTFVNGCAARLPIDLAHDLLAEISCTLMPQQAQELLELQIGRPGLKDVQVQRLIDIWTKVSPGQAAEQLLVLLDQRPVSDRGWMEDRLRNVALSHGRPLDAARALVRLAERNRDPAAILSIRDEVGGRLEGTAKIAFDGEIALSVTRVTRDERFLDEAALIAVDLPRQWRMHAQLAEAEEAESLLRGLLDLVSDDVRELIKGAGVTAEVGIPVVLPEVMHVTDLFDALSAAAHRHSDLVVLKDAWDSARRCERGNIRKAAGILEGIGKVATDWKQGRVDPWVELRQLPCEFIGSVSEQAVRDYPEDYRRRDDTGAVIELGPHFKVGNKANLCRIYLSIDKAHQRIVIGHVGEKLRDSTNPS